MRPSAFDGRPLAVPVSGTTRWPSRVYELVQDVGSEPLVGGGLERAGPLDATAALFIALRVGEGADAKAIEPPLAYAARLSRQGAEGGTGLSDSSSERCRCAVFDLGGPDPVCIS